MTTEKGVWDIQDIRDKQLVSSTLWQYDTTEFELWTAGLNSSGELGLNSRTNYSSPVQVGSGKDWKAVSRPAMSGGDPYHMFASKTDGTMWAWGNNEDGALGHNNQTDYSSPVQIPGTTWSDKLFSTHKSSFATKTDGTLWSWGYNSPSYGQLGHNNKTNYSSPRQIPGTTWDKLSIGDMNAYSIKTDGTFWSWGQGNYGMLGHNNDTAYSSPRQIGSRTVWAEISAGASSAAAIVKNTPGSWEEGGLYMFGNNERGQLGFNNNTNYSSPRFMSASWHSISSSQSTNVAIRNYVTGVGGSIWAWGSNEHGELANNDGGDNNHRSTPTQIGSNTNWTYVVGGYRNFYAGKSDGTIWAWGLNTHGQLGLNDRVPRSSPTQVPGNYEEGSGWSKLSGGFRRAL